MKKAELVKAPPDNVLNIKTLFDISLSNLY